MVLGRSGGRRAGHSQRSGARSLIPRGTYAQEHRETTGTGEVGLGAEQARAKPVCVSQGCETGKIRPGITLGFAVQNAPPGALSDIVLKVVCFLPRFSTDQAQRELKRFLACLGVRSCLSTKSCFKVLPCSSEHLWVLAVSGAVQGGRKPSYSGSTFKHLNVAANSGSTIPT